MNTFKLRSDHSRLQANIHSKHSRRFGEDLTNRRWLVLPLALSLIASATNSSILLAKQTRSVIRFNSR